MLRYIALTAIRFALIVGLTTLAACRPNLQAGWARGRTILDYNARSNFGGDTLRSGFSPDPWAFPLTAGGGRSPIDVASLDMYDAVSNEHCSRSFVTRPPDFHFTFHSGSHFSFLRFYVVTASGIDATLVINEPNLQWRCNDDHGHSDWGNPLMPAIDFRNPPPGRYDIWVGTAVVSANNPANLYVTELESNHP